MKNTIILMDEFERKYPCKINLNLLMQNLKSFVAAIHNFIVY